MKEFGDNHELFRIYPELVYVFQHQTRFWRERPLIFALAWQEDGRVVGMMGEEIGEMEIEQNPHKKAMEAMDVIVFGLEAVWSDYSVWRQMAPFIMKHVGQAMEVIEASGLSVATLTSQVIFRKNSVNYPSVFFDQLPDGDLKKRMFYEDARMVVKKLRYTEVARGRLPDWLDRAIRSNGNFPKDLLTSGERLLLGDAKRELATLLRVYRIGEMADLGL